MYIVITNYDMMACVKWRFFSHNCSGLIVYQGQGSYEALTNKRETISPDKYNCSIGVQPSKFNGCVPFGATNGILIGVDKISSFFNGTGLQNGDILFEVTLKRKEEPVYSKCLQ